MKLIEPTMEYDRQIQAFRRTILACGGAYESTVFEPESQSTIERYWIHLPR